MKACSNLRSRETVKFSRVTIRKLAKQVVRDERLRNRQNRPIGPFFAIFSRYKQFFIRKNPILVIIIDKTAQNWTFRASKTREKLAITKTTETTNDSQDLSTKQQCLSYP